MTAALHAIPISRYLSEIGFGGEPKRAQGAEGLFSIPAPPEDTGMVTPEELAAQIQAAFVRGRDEGRSLAQAQYAIRLQEERLRHDQALVRERQAWAEQEAARLDDALAAGIGQLGRDMADRTAGILKPFLVARLREQAMTELLAALEPLMSTPGELKVQVRGPHDLVERVRARIEGRVSELTAIASENVEVTLTMANTVLESRIGAWTARVEEALA